MHPLFDIILPAILAVLSWAMPQPVHSEGLLVIYGGQRLIEANADWRGYDLGLVPNRCGLSGISPAMLGQLAWVRVPGREWVGPCVVVDAVARVHAYESVFLRKEVAEISWDVAAQLGFDNGGRWGEVFFGPCPPNADSIWATPERYEPPLRWDEPPYEPNLDFYPYPEQQTVAAAHCNK